LKTARFLWDNRYFDAATLTAASAAAGYPVSCLQDPQRSRKWRSTGLSSQWIKADLGAAVNWNAIALVDHNLSFAATLDILGGTYAGGNDVVNKTAVPAWLDVIGYGEDRYGLLGYGGKFLEADRKWYIPRPIRIIYLDVLAEKCRNSGADGLTDWVDSNSDGKADYWDSGFGSPVMSIVTGNGFTGNAQRLALAASGGGCLTHSAGLTVGHSYQVTFKYRSSDPLNVCDWNTTSYGVFPSNNGLAVEATCSFVATSYWLTFWPWGAGINSWFEVDEVSIKEIGGDEGPVANSRYFTMNITDAANTDGYFEIGRMFVGLFNDFGINFTEINAQYIDDSDIKITLGGQPWGVQLPVRNSIELVFDWLDYGDRYWFLQFMAQKMGLSSSFLLDCFPESIKASERHHNTLYGRFTSLPKFDQTSDMGFSSGDTRSSTVDLTVEEVL